MSRHRIDEVILRQCRHLPSIGIDSRTDCPSARSSSARRALGEEAGMTLRFEIGARLQGLGPVGEAAHAHDMIGRAAPMAGAAGAGPAPLLARRMTTLKPS